MLGLDAVDFFQRRPLFINKQLPVLLCSDVVCFVTRAVLRDILLHFLKPKLILIYRDLLLIEQGVRIVVHLR